METQSKHPKSKYARKKASGRQLYGPGCCAHTISKSRVDAAKEHAREQEREDRKAAYRRHWKDLNSADPQGRW